MLPQSATDSASAQELTRAVGQLDAKTFAGLRDTLIHAGDAVRLLDSARGEAAILCAMGQQPADVRDNN